MQRYRFLSFTLTLALFASILSGIVGATSPTLAAAPVAVAPSLAQVKPDQPAACITPPGGMTAWWPFDEAAGPTAFDITGNANHGTWTGALTAVTGKVAGALYFNGGYVDVPNSPTVNFGTGDLSMDFWARMIQGNPPVIIDKRTAVGGGYVGYVLRRVGSNQLQFEISDGTSVYNVTSAPLPTLTNNLWHFIAVTLNRSGSSGITLYFDNAVVGVGSAAGSGSITNPANLWIGKSHLNSQVFIEGGLDELEFFNRELTSNEVSALFAADADGKCKGQATPTPRFSATATCVPGQQGCPTSTATPCIDPVGVPCTPTSQATNTTQPQPTDTETITPRPTFTPQPTNTTQSGPSPTPTCPPGIICVTPSATPTERPSFTPQPTNTVPTQASATPTCRPGTVCTSPTPQQATSTPTMPPMTMSPPCCVPRTITITAGLNDNFAAPFDPVSPSIDLINHVMSYGPGAQIRNFDDPAANKFFAHTFTALRPTDESRICAAYLTVRLRPTQDNPGNDAFGVGFAPPTGAGFAFWRYLGSGNPQPGLFAFPWTVGTGAQTLTLDLSALPLAPSGTLNLLPQIQANGYLDLLSQDDTMFDYAQLVVRYCCECEPRITSYPAGRNDNFALPTETAVPGPGMSAYLSGLGSTLRHFDDTTPNRFFGHTFTGLQDITGARICSATLEIRMKPGLGGSANDSIHMGVAPAGVNPWSWSHRIGNPGGLGAPFPAFWSPPAPAVTHIFDLNALPTGTGTTSLLALMNSTGYLDVGVQDDTAVDYMVLTIRYCCRTVNQTPIPIATSTPKPTRTPYVTPTRCPIPWTDITGSVFRSYIERLGCLRIVNGTSNTTFSPNANITRGQIAKIVSLAYGLETVNNDTPTFADVPSNHVFYQNIESAAAYDVIGGFPCGGPGEACDNQNRPYFRPAANATRGQLARIIVNGGGFSDDPVEEGVQSFTDVPSSYIFYRSIEIAAARGIISGQPCGGPGEPCDSQNRPYFRPNANATRGQVTKMVSVGMDEYGQPPHPPSR